MDKFIDSSTNGNEHAFRRGIRVPDGDINLAWVQAPRMNPQDNIIIIDTSQMTPENLDSSVDACKLYYADEFGVLEDKFGNRLVKDEYPVVTDVFKVEEDWSLIPGNEYTDDDILPYVHVSRYFHIDSETFFGALPGMSGRVSRPGVIKVVDDRGKEYLDEDGKPKYVIMAAQAQSQAEDNTDRNTAAYRIYVYVKNQEDSLYLQYNKGEIDSGDGAIRALNPTHKERLNPLPFFSWVPEETDVMDWKNVKSKIYTTKPINMKEQVIGLPAIDKSGYQVTVPRKAILDPRIFQLFRWRVSCDFVEEFKVDPTDTTKEVRVGCLYTGARTTAPRAYSFYNMERSRFNIGGLSFVNPLIDNLPDNEAPAKSTAEYWSVNFDTITPEELKKFDVLLWTVDSDSFDFSTYMPKINYIVNDLGKMLIVDLIGGSVSGLGCGMTARVNAITGDKLVDGVSGWVYGDDVKVLETVKHNHPFFDALDQIGGWDFNDGVGDEYASLTPALVQAIPYFTLGRGKNHYLTDVPSNWTTLITSKDENDATKPVMVEMHNRNNGGRMVVSTLWTGPNTLISDVTGNIISNNSDSTAYQYDSEDYEDWVSSYAVEGKMKLFYNMCLLGVRGSRIDSRDERKATSSWTYSSKWRGSWVINNREGVLSPSEIERNDFYFEPRYVTVDNPFIDVTSSHPFYDAIMWAASQGIVDGYSDGSFRPGEPVTRQALAQFLYDNAGSPAGAENPLFYDVTETHPFYDAIAWVASEGILNGYGNNTFRPGNEVNRGVLALALYRAAGSPTGAPAHGFTDVDGDNPYDEAIAWAKDEGILYGYSDNTFGWDKTATRQVAAVALWRQAGSAEYDDEVEDNGGSVWLRRLSSFNLKTLVEDGLSQEDLNKVAGMRRTYRIEVTNPNVLVPDTDNLSDNSYPTAWTEAYTPKFVVPGWFGPHIIKEDHVQGDYDASQYMHKDYPAKPFAGLVQATLQQTDQTLVTEEVNWTLTGTANKSYVTQKETKAHWKSHGEFSVGGGYWTSNGASAADYGVTHPRGLGSWTQANYYAPSHVTSFPHFGLWGRYALGSKGEEVAFLQEFFNQMNFWGFVPLPNSWRSIAVDGYFGTQTEAAVKNFQDFSAHIYNQCRRFDGYGVVDAETLGAIGKQILRLDTLFYTTNGTLFPSNPNDHTRWFALPRERMHRRNLSDDTDRPYIQRSLTGGGPSGSIWDMVQICLQPVANGYEIFGVSMTPWLEGASKQLHFYGVDIGFAGDYPSADFSSLLSGGVLGNYNQDWINFPVGGQPMPDGQEFFFALGPRRGDTATIKFAQHGGTGIGNSKTWGFKNIYLHLKELSSGYRQVEISKSGKSFVKTGQIVRVWPYPDNPSGGTLSDIRWTNVTLDPPNDNVSVSFDSVGSLTFRHYLMDTSDYSYTYYGQAFGVASAVVSLRAMDDSIVPLEGLRTMSEDGVVSPVINNGWISKKDGVRLLCDASGNPVGFPELPAANSAENETQRHYTRLSINRTLTDPSIRMGFYDKSQKEFIFNEAGEAVMTYWEYAKRGPQNIYVAVICDYEDQTNKPIPEDPDAPPLPFRKAMPVYGLCSHSNKRIGIEPLPKNLSAFDLWAVPIRVGSFTRKVQLPNPNNGGYPVTETWLREYHGQSVTAFYSVPEADLGGWSHIYGRPYTDVEGETPLILSDSVIQVRQPPLLAKEEPVNDSYKANPVRPVIRVHTREAIGDSWTQLQWYEIKDWDLSDGTIELVNPLTSLDPNLIKVDYTSARPVYQFKQYDGNDINLNPYPQQSGRDKIGKPIYIYLVPKFVRDAQNRLITGSTVSRTLRWTLDSSIFSPTSPAFNPLAVMLGVIYISPGLDIEKLVMVDTRRRGGGAYDTTAMQELQRVVQESLFYWDLSPAYGQSYPKGGFVIIRLPSALKTQFTKDDIIEVIDRNITAGVGYKIEDLEGNEW